jgi:hypothetical protein
MPAPRLSSARPKAMALAHWILLAIEKPTSTMKESTAMRMKMGFESISEVLNVKEGVGYCGMRAGFYSIQA